MKCMKPMMNWVDANINKSIASHNLEFHWKHDDNHFRLSERFSDAERDARDKLLRMM